MTTALRAKLIDGESAGQIGRGQGVNHFAVALFLSLSPSLFLFFRACRLSHDIVSRTANTTRRVEAPRARLWVPGSPGEKDDRPRREKKRVVGAFCGFGVGNGTTKGSPPA